MFARVDTRSVLRLCIARAPLCAASTTAGGGNFGDGNRISDDAEKADELVEDDVKRRTRQQLLVADAVYA